ncbi:uncharacterized zinc finger CCHC domain-containing protein At4g19190 [Alnus glutinosa]|uniref:uncharacterized zinc finger CCHC domain-containing protein At4g19190 n=1 Tax=Alnus glutinosa TaxID=3517 RepID=UPI002D79170A|nr:uncharacterized zinc finger CCHC domain-containing protein At4g19190 [Alnus glutinosa]
MEGEEGGGIRLSKRFSDKGGGGEVDYKTKAGTAWSHSYLNQKPWHPLSYPNQRRKWIAEQTHAQRDRRAEEVAREYAQEQEFFRQSALISKKEKEKVEMMKAVSFMYVRPPGYNAESAKAADIADEKKREEQNNPSQDPLADGASTAMPPESVPVRGEEKKKPRPKDVFGRPLPTEEEFEVLKNAPRMETGVPARVKPFGVEVRNVKCLRCGNYGHQSGDRECPLKDAIMPNEESRLKRDDPLNAILAHADPSEPLKWELKQKPGVSPPRGGFKLDDPNQQIVADDIFDEYGGFLSGGDIPMFLTNFSDKSKKSRKRSKRKKQQPQPSRELNDPNEDELSSEDGEKRSKKKKCKTKKKRRNHSESSSSDSTESDRRKKSRHKHSYSSEDSAADRNGRSKKCRDERSYSSEDSDLDRHHKSDKSRPKRSFSSEESEPGRHHRSYKSRHKNFYSSQDPESERHHRSYKSTHKDSYSYEERRHRGDKSRDERLYSSKDSDLERHHRSDKSRDKRLYSSKDSDLERHHRSDKSGDKRLYSSKESDLERHHRSDKSRDKHLYLSKDSDIERHRRSDESRNKKPHPHSLE